jgi:hypothetical protein
MKTWDVTPATDKWSRQYARLEYLRIGIARPFSTIIDVATILKPCDCTLDEMIPERVSFQENVTHLCRKCLGGITAEMNDAYNRQNDYSGYDEDDNE